MSTKSFTLKNSVKKNILSISPLNTVENQDYHLETSNNINDMTRNEMKYNCNIM